MTKKCTKCSEIKELSEFYKNKTCKLGVMARCKECVKQAAKDLSLREKKEITHKTCGHCNVKKAVSEFHKAVSRIDGYHNNCKNCKNRHRWTPNGKYLTYKREAKNRGIDFALTKDEFLAFWQKPCEYCGNEIETIGIDRVDSSLAYSIDNVKSCCKTCNYMKRSYSFSFWIKHMRKILSQLDKDG